MGPRLHLEPCPGEVGNNCFPTITFAILSARSNSISNDTMWEPFGLTISVSVGIATGLGSIGWIWLGPTIWYHSGSGETAPL